MELSYLSSLVKLNFGKPHGAAQQVSGIEMFPKILYLGVHSEENALSGSIPANFSSLLELETMDLRNCSLTGTLPPELSDLHENLEVMLLSNNNLTGSVPSSWSALTGLRRLDLGE
jgi:Leucine Rich Repeat